MIRIVLGAFLVISKRLSTAQLDHRSRTKPRVLLNRPGFAGGCLFESRYHSELFDLRIVGGFCLGGRDVADGLE